MDYLKESRFDLAYDGWTCLPLMDCADCNEALVDLCFFQYPKRKKTNYFIDEELYDPDQCDEKDITQ